MTTRAVIFGRVIRGLGLGKKLGFATLNLSPRRIPKTLHFGIYAVRVETPAGKFGGVAHYGKRSFHGAPVSFEVHCFGLKKNLYGKRVKVFLIKRLRGVKKFLSISALRQQIRRDIAQAKKLL